MKNAMNKEQLRKNYNKAKLLEIVNRRKKNDKKKIVRQNSKKEMLH